MEDNFRKIVIAIAAVIAAAVLVFVAWGSRKAGYQAGYIAGRDLDREDYYENVKNLGYERGYDEASRSAGEELAKTKEEAAQSLADAGKNAMDFRVILSSIPVSDGEEVTVITGISPDTDSAAATQAFSGLLKKLGFNAVPATAGGLNNETKGLFGRYEVEELPYLEKAPEGKVFLVGVSDLLQAADGLSEDSTVGIINNEGGNGFSANPAVLTQIIPTGSVSTIVYNMFRSCGEAPEEEEARLLLAGIVSATDNLTSEGTTEMDSSAAAELMNLLGLESADSLYTNLRTDGSSYEGMPDWAVYYSDYRSYLLNGAGSGTGASTGIGIGETRVLSSDAEAHRAAMHAYMEDCYSRQKMDGLVHMCQEYASEDELMFGNAERTVLSVKGLGVYPLLGHAAAAWEADAAEGEARTFVADDAAESITFTPALKNRDELYSYMKKAYPESHAEIGAAAGRNGESMSAAAISGNASGAAGNAAGVPGAANTASTAGATADQNDKIVPAAETKPAQSVTAPVSPTAPNAGKNNVVIQPTTKAAETTAISETPEEETEGYAVINSNVSGTQSETGPASGTSGKASAGENVEEIIDTEG